MLSNIIFFLLGWSMKDRGISHPRLEEHVKPSVAAVMNIYGNHSWEVTALKYTD